MKNKFYIFLVCLTVLVGGAFWGGNASCEESSDSIPIDVLDFKNMDVQDVLKLISQKSGLNIVASQNVKGRVTVYLRNTGVLDALGIIVDAYGWAYAKEGEIVRVMTAQDFESKYGKKFGQDIKTEIKQLRYAKPSDALAVLNQIKGPGGKIIVDEKSNTLILVDSPDKLKEMDGIIKRIDVPVETEVFELTYAKAEDMSNKIAEVLTPDLGSMRFDERSNRIVVSDDGRVIEKIRHIIEAFDQRDREVLIDAKILKITLSDDYRLGVDWQGLVNDYHQLTFDSQFDVLDDATETRFGKVGIGDIGMADGTGPDNYTALIEALKVVGKTETLSNPRIMTVNNQEAKILVGTSEPYVTSTTTTADSGGPIVSEAVNFIEVGVKLYVTPTIHKDDFITMKIKPEVSNAAERLATTNSSIPIVTTTEAETTVLVKNGVTILIGGLIEEETSNTVRKVPLLGDIPLIKHAFRSQSDSVSKTELVIFLTPHIISGEIDLEDEISFF